MSAYAFAREFFESLAACGVSRVCICPGSRSTPLALMAEKTPGLTTFVHVDERSAGFFALGLARAAREPVALVCTSGTAVANFLPAVIEAHHAQVPLVVLSADRPPELRDWGAGQTIDQLKIFGDAVRWFAEVPVPSDGVVPGFARGLARRAVGEACGSSSRARGPVHLNWPLREPLEPKAGELERASEAPPALPVARGVTAPDAKTVATLADLARFERGLIVCGPADLEADEVDAIAGLSRATAWPIVADPASQLRTGPHVDETTVLAASDLWWRDAEVAAAVAPDVVVRIGATPVSKALRLALEARPPKEVVLLAPAGDAQDPSQLATQVVVADVAPTARAWRDAIAAPRASTSWSEQLAAIDRAARRAVDDCLDAPSTSMSEVVATCVVCDALADDALLFASNSMPIRYVDALLRPAPTRRRVLANRGANGIDGVTSSALGAAAAGERVVLLTGDLAFVHDLGGLLAASRYELSATIVVLDNDGGGIFSFLPVAKRVDADAFESLFRVPHGLDLEYAARLFGAHFERVSSPELLGKALGEAAPRSGLSIVHVPVDRDASVAAFRDAIAAAGVAARQVVSS